jgi:hypothetical protein
MLSFLNNRAFACYFLMGWPDEKHWLQSEIGCGWLQQATYTTVINQLMEEIYLF